MTDYTFKLPDLGEGTVESEIGEWFIKVGDDVEEEQVVATMMTDKAAVELSSPVSGKVKKLAGEPGDVIAVGAPLVVFETDRASAAAAAEAEDEGDTADLAAASVEDEGSGDEAPAASDTQSEAGAAPAPAAGKPARIITSPAIRRMAKEADVDLSEVDGSGPGGRILREDFEAFVEAREAGATSPAVRRRATKTRDIKVIGLRRIIAERMSAAKREIPHFTYVEEVDVTELEALRAHMNASRGDGERLTPLPFLAMALIRALREFPQCNALYDKDRNVIVQHEAVHLGIATQTPDGLKVPVVRHAEARSLTELSAEMRRVAEAARDNTAKKEELAGSTITITSLGRLGGIVSTPVINSPEVGIIGVNRAVERPVVVNGQVTVRTMMNLSSSFDHRFVDGYDAAAMIQRIREMLEHPATIFIED